MVAVEYRGRGLSDHDPDPAKYAVPVEAGDVLTVLSHLQVSRAIALGTSRGGFISMALAGAMPNLWAGVILNDIGPVLDNAGLVRIKGYVGGHRPLPRDWNEAAQMIRTMFARDFPNLTDADWLAWAHRAFRETGEGLVRTYDPALSHTLAAVDPDAPPPPLWELFDPMAAIPLMLIWGVRSDLLSADGVSQMQARRPDLALVAVADQGHAPLLADQATIARIAAFCAACDRAQSQAA